MASTPTLNLFHIYAVDKPDSQRMKHAAKHLEQNAPHFQSGIIRLGGGLLPADVKSTDADAATKMTGSFIIAQAESIDAIWALIKKDIFYTSGEVWDLEKVFVTPVFIPLKEAKFD
ncbi:uncharacterized protein TRAVEDRAFT_23196 [Trametes versicolor FP-101664 SS1]|uniref:uncharacterized protein n=1 Tax=Trametes versicolor (strain FP-101664) TaxID=717944 RepID=UPI0004621C59|nr:uncharacterized protein TRAVEDRAFT_23196 [Trametes versicolor FP-101664 SS1]EIW53940.1 hypothetical protein TRAVEDRAFT_23196 [Trametes versicolor FP-101664 SS1]